MIYVHSNIDVRIRQAELEYALGREELHLLSLVEEIRALQSRLDKSLKNDLASTQNALYTQIQNGMNLTLHAALATLGRFGVNSKQDVHGLFVEWALDGESLYRGDRIIECNGKIIATHTKEDFHKMTNGNSKCELVLIRKRNGKQQHQQLLIQSQEDNQRLQHRISYLEDQVKELQQSSKEIILAQPVQNQKQNSRSPKGDHVTSINISSPVSPKCPNDNKPQIFQRGNFVATIVGGKAVQTSYPVTATQALPTHSMHTTKTVIKDVNGCLASDSEHDLHYRTPRNGLQHSQSQQYIRTNGKLFGSSSKISISNDTQSSHSVSRHKDKREQYKENRRIQRESMDRHNSHPNLLNGDVGS